MLGLQLVDADVANIPMIDADPYGKFIPGPNGLPQYRLTTGALVEGNRTTPVPAPANVVRIGTAFLNDIAHSADPGNPTAAPDAGREHDRRRQPRPRGGRPVRQRAARHPRHLW